MGLNPPSARRSHPRAVALRRVDQRREAHRERGRRPRGGDGDDTDEERATAGSDRGPRVKQPRTVCPGPRREAGRRRRSPAPAAGSMRRRGGAPAVTAPGSAARVTTRASTSAPTTSTTRSTWSPGDGSARPAPHPSGTATTASATTTHLRRRRAGASSQGPGEVERQPVARWSTPAASSTSASDGDDRFDRAIAWPTTIRTRRPRPRPPTRPAPRRWAAARRPRSRSAPPRRR